MSPKKPAGDSGKAPGGNRDKRNAKLPRSALETEGRFSPQAPFGKPPNVGDVNVEQLKANIAICWVNKAFHKEGCFIPTSITRGTEQSMHLSKLGAQAILNRKGPDGNTAMKQQPDKPYSYIQFVYVFSDNTFRPNLYKQKQAQFIRYMNSLCVPKYFKFRQIFRKGKDFTSDPPRTVDCALLDNDVVDLIQSLYPDIESLEQISGNDAEMAKFWTQVTHGRALIHERIAQMKRAAADAAAAAAAAADSDEN